MSGSRLGLVDFVTLRTLLRWRPAFPWTDQLYYLYLLLRNNKIFIYIGEKGVKAFQCEKDFQHVKS